MANNRKSLSRRKNGKLVSTSNQIKQIIYSEPRRIFKERYITDHMLEKAIRQGLSKKEALDKYGKNRYVNNPNAVPVKTIIHSNI